MNHATSTPPPTTPPHGPFDTEAEATAAARHIYEESRATSQPGAMTRLNAAALTAALRQANVEVGAYDLRIATWLTRWEPETIAVVTGWITRANGGAR